jgi:arylsulfatase A-like enzyme
MKRFLPLAAVVTIGCADPDRRLVDRIASPRADVTLGAESMRSLTPALGERVEVEIDVPPPGLRPLLRFSTGVEAPRPAPRARVTFRVTLTSDGLTTIVHDREVRSEEHNRWESASVDLAAWAGRRATLAFEVFPTKSIEEAPWSDRVRVAWGDPAIETRKPAKSAQLPPSVLLVVVDALRYDYLGVNGFEGEISPNLDWLAFESVRFEDAFSTAPWTKPSVASILTGLPPERHGVVRLNRKWAEGLSEEAVTLAESFRERGYRTAAYVANAWLSPAHGFGQGFDTYVVERKDEALIERLRSEIPFDKPAFVYLHLIGAHGPYRAPEADYRILRESPSLGPDRELEPTDPPRPDHLEMTPFAMEGEARELRAWKAKYAAAVRQVDRRLGSLLNDLRASGVLDRTLVVLTADHGEEFLEHGSWEHGYELCSHQLHVPLWIRLPGAAAAGTRVATTVSLVDLKPALLHLARLPLPTNVEGMDSAVVASAVIGEPELHSLWTDEHRFQWNEKTGDDRLFARGRESEDISALEPEVLVRLRKRLTEILAETRRAGTLSPERRSISEDTREELRALGYLKE